ncbi:MAG: GT2 family glycosyltransferase [Myxococcota bacterium]|jgi:GT2 family glycosyltransferase
MSVVIPVYNGGSAFGLCLDALSSSDHERFEVLVVDDGSTDGSAALALARGFEVIRQARQGPAAARNAGAARARGEILILLDADVVTPPGALSQAARVLRDTPEISGLSAMYSAESRARGFGSQYLNLKQRYFQLQLPPLPDTAWTAFFVVWRRAFVECGGLDATQAHPAADDLVLGCRLLASGHRLAFCRDIEVEHLKEVSVVGTWRFHHVHAREWSRAVRRHRLLLPQKASHSRRPVGNTVIAGLLVGLLVSAPVAVVLVPVPWGLAVGTMAVGAVVWNAGFLRWLARHRGLRFAACSLPVALVEGLANASGLLAAQVPDRLGPAALTPRSAT